MHISKFYQLLRENNSIDIISQIEDTKQRERAKELIMVLILSTDMA